MKSATMSVAALMASVAVPAHAASVAAPVLNLPVLQAQLNADAKLVTFDKSTLATDMNQVAKDRLNLKAANTALAAAAKAGNVGAAKTYDAKVHSLSATLATLNARVAKDQATLHAAEVKYNADKAARDAAKKK